MSKSIKSTYKNKKNKTRRKIKGGNDAVDEKRKMIKRIDQSLRSKLYYTSYIIDYLSYVFCKLINHPVFEKQIFDTYVKVIRQMFDSTLYNCIGETYDNTKNNIICEKLDDIYKNLSISFQNVNIIQRNVNVGEELKIGGGYDEDFIKQFNEKFFVSYRNILNYKFKKIFESSIYKKPYFNSDINYDTFFNLKNLKTDNLNKIRIDKFLNTHIPKNRPLFFGGEGVTIQDIINDKDAKDNLSKSFTKTIPIILNCSNIQKFVFNGFDMLLKSRVNTNIHKIESFISDSLSELMLIIYDKGNLPRAEKYEYKFKLINSFVKNHPINNIFYLLNNQPDDNVLSKVINRITASDPLLNKIYKIWDEKTEVFTAFFKKYKDFKLGIVINVKKEGKRV